MIERTCQNCNKTYHAYLNRNKNFCSQVCRGLSSRGKPSWNKGLKGYTNRGSFGVGHKGLTASANGHWKPESIITYSGVHQWVRRQLGRPQECKFCGSMNEGNRRYHWANISRKYRKIVDDWVRLCVKCHKAYDRDARVALR